MAEATMSGDDRLTPPPPVAEEDWPVPWQPVVGPDDGPWRHVEALFVRALLGSLGRLPQPLLTRTLGGLARLARRLDRRHSAAARAFLTQALGELPREELERRVLQSYRHFLRVLIDARRWRRVVPRERLPEHFEVVWTDEARRVAQGTKGCIFVTAHLGSWEALLAVGPWLGFRPAYPVGKPMKSAPLSRDLQTIREANGARLLPRRGAMAAAPKVLEAGGALGLLLDQRARKKPVYASFFGRPARCDRSAAVLVRRMRVPVVFAFCTYRDDGPLSFRVTFPAVLWPEDLAGATPEDISARINAVFEEVIRASPDQYLWHHDRYRDTPLAIDPSA